MAYHGKIQALASKIGEFFDSEPSSFDFEGNFYRVRVRLDVRQPLKKAISLIRGGQREIFAVKYERLPDWCQVCGMMGHEFKEHGDGVHPPSALVFKNLRAPATTAWGTRRCNRNRQNNYQNQQKEEQMGHNPGTSHDGEAAEGMELDTTRKRTSDQVVISPNIKLTGMELVPVPKPVGNEKGVPISPPPKQDTKRSKLMGQLGKPSSSNDKEGLADTVKKNPNGVKSSDARAAASVTEDRRTQ